jgi:hypothetical protein
MSKNVFLIIGTLLLIACSAGSGPKGPGGDPDYDAGSVVDSDASSTGGFVSPSNLGTDVDPSDLVGSPAEPSESLPDLNFDGIAGDVLGNSNSGNTGSPDVGVSTGNSDTSGSTTGGTSSGDTGGNTNGSTSGGVSGGSSGTTGSDSGTGSSTGGGSDDDDDNEEEPIDCTKVWTKKLRFIEIIFCLSH